ncbi:hypothetical protein [Chryseobacterium luquanense]|uniref:Uncharacterized protein n=1 Tax=Chryseobacterium luquanense TaxID=2983766 RepID=A0ABT3Y8Y9_9FLAO|nr:hypothetical protein [Chryseobacterium luquanense]MCX8534644.1 hypothetical protein [Chryseobacterium luquanense]
MKNSVVFWLFIIAISGIVIFFREFESTVSNKKFLFKRNYTTSISLKKVSEYDLKGNNVTTNTGVYNILKTSNDSTMINYKIDFMSYYGKKEDGIKISLPSNYHIDYCDNSNAIMIDKFKLKVYSFTYKKLSLIQIDSFKVFSFFPIKNSNGTLLVLGEFKTKKNDYVTGFYTINESSNQLKLVHAIETNKTDLSIDNALIYAGKFTGLGAEKIAYYCDKYSKIFFFKNGNFTDEFQTNDNAPKAKLLKGPDGTYYKRGDTFTTNNAVFEKDGKLFVFSARTDNVDSIVMDVYDLKFHKYIFSTKIHEGNLTSSDIDFASLEGDLLHIVSGSKVFNYSFLSMTS